MKEVKVQSKFKCDFCKKKSVQWRMIKHERICYLNPDRMCRQPTRLGYEFLKGDHDPECLDCIKSKDAIKREKEKNEIHYPDALELHEGV